MTVGDPNRIKRFLHRSRFKRAVKKMGELATDSEVLDFGAGNGELMHYLHRVHPNVRMTLFEPATKYEAELRRNVSGYDSKARVVTHFDELEDNHFSNVFCLSVMEHLPEAELSDALGRLSYVAAQEASVLVEVPNEIFTAAILKGSLGHIRRHSEYDGRIRNIIRATIGKPPTDRPLSNFDPEGPQNLPWHGHHTGFDHRALERTINESGLFEIEGRSFGPINALGAIASLDVYYSLTPTNND